jgi:hypothetical protein
MHCTIIVCSTVLTDSMNWSGNMKGFMFYQPRGCQMTGCSSIHVHFTVSLNGRLIILKSDQLYFSFWFLPSKYDVLYSRFSTIWPQRFTQ